MLPICFFISNLQPKDSRRTKKNETNTHFIINQSALDDRERGRKTSEIIAKHHRRSGDYLTNGCSIDP